MDRREEYLKWLVEEGLIAKKSCNSKEIENYENVYQGKQGNYERFDFEGLKNEDVPNSLLIKQLWQSYEIKKDLSVIKKCILFFTVLTSVSALTTVIAVIFLFSQF